MTGSLKQTVNERAQELFRRRLAANYRLADHIFAWLIGVQWAAGIVTALWVSPKTWAGQFSSPHIHLWVAIFLGGVVHGYPAFLAVTRPGAVLTRHVVAAGQMLGGGLLIHLSGGRIETHFQYFGALAFLSFYRDWRILVTATLVSAVDHFARGLFWPLSIFGVMVPSGWRALEHACWILYEDAFLFLAIHQTIQEMQGIAERQAKLENVRNTIELKVQERTSDLYNEIAERRRAEESLRLLSSAVDQSTESIMITNAQLDSPGPEIVFVNPAFTSMTGYTAEEALGKTPRILQGPRTNRAVLDQLRRKLQNGEGFEGEAINYRKDKTEFSMEWQIAPIRNSKGEITHFIAIQHDISERKQAEQQREETMQKEIVLRREIHHRVKNNLQIITSLLYLQSSKVSDPNLIALLRDSQARIRSIALVHEMLYQREDLIKISFSGYVRQLATDLFVAYRANPEDITLKINSASVFLDLNTAVPCGIIITELITNALKYAFPDGKKGEIEIDVQPMDESGTWAMAVRDNGIGLPASLDLNRAQTMGLSMVHDLAHQLGGMVEFHDCIFQCGTSVKITLPKPASSSGLNRSFSPAVR